MKEVFLIKCKDGGFRPAWEEDAGLLNYVKEDQIIQVSFRRPRNPANHRRFFKMLAVVIENMPDDVPDRYRNVEYLRYELMIGIGHCEIRHSKGGKEYPVPKTISFESVDEETFRDIYNKSVDYLLKHFLKGLDKDELIEVVEENIKLFV